MSPGDHPAAPNVGDHVVQFGMQQRLAAADRDHGGAQIGQMVQAVLHFIERDGAREIVEFVAIRAGEIAPPDGNDVDEQRMPSSRAAPRRSCAARAHECARSAICGAAGDREAVASVSLGYGTEARRPIVSEHVARHMESPSGLPAGTALYCLQFEKPSIFADRQTIGAGRN